MTDERRAEQRTMLKAAHPLRAEVPVNGFPVPCTVVPHDISPAGIRGRWDVALPREGEFRMTLELSEPFLCVGRVAWMRDLPKGAVLAGVAFASLTESARRVLRAYLEAVQGQSRRRGIRMDDLLPIELVMPGGIESLSIIATDVSLNGMQITNDFPLPTAEPLTLLLPLEWDRPPLEAIALVRWQKPTLFGGFCAGLEFLSPPQEMQERLERYLGTLSQWGEKNTDVARPFED